jgi:hypothetical protein
MGRTVFPGSRFHLHLQERRKNSATGPTVQLCRRFVLKSSIFFDEAIKITEYACIPKKLFLIWYSARFP